MTPFLRKQVLERGLDRPLGGGRIYRVVHESSKPRPAGKLSTASNAELIALLAHPNAWHRETAQRLLCDRADPAAVALLEKALESEKNDVGRLHILWTLEGLNKLTNDPVAVALGDKEPAVRASAIGISRRFLTTIPDPDILNELDKLRNDTHPDVRRELVLTLGTIVHPRVDAILEPALKTASTDGKAARRPPRRIHDAPRPNSDRTARRGQLEETGAVAREVHQDRRQSGGQTEEPPRVSTAPAPRGDSAAGRSVATDGSGRRHDPDLRERSRGPADQAADRVGGARQAAQVERSEGGEGGREPREASSLARQGRQAAPGPLPPLSEKHQELFDAGKTHFLATCAACHHPAGYGRKPGKGPPLIDSDWARGSPQKLVRIVLHGLHGPISINKEPFNKDASLEMPAMAMALDDTKIASALTYIRREFGDGAAPVEIATVQSVRAWENGRTEQWTEKELAKIK